jgi:PTH1 family peptidyl-tRNA hydrolase
VKLVVGLGNPGRDYARTRHNVGFLVVEEIARRGRAGWRRSLRFPARTATVAAGGGPATLLAQPLTFMNRSGDAVGPLMRKRGIAPDGLVVVYDDADLPVGTLRVRPFGGPGGHNGMRSVIAAIGTDRFARIRIGIGRGGGAAELVEHVLAAFSADEWKIVDETIRQGADAALCWAVEGIEPAMNRFNRRSESRSER